MAVPTAIFVICVLVLLAAAGFAQRGREEAEIVLKSETDYQRVASLVHRDDMRDTIRSMSSLGSRVPGYPGSEKASQMVMERFRKLGLQDVHTEEFPVVAPVVQPDEKGRAATVSIDGGRTFEILPMWPNLVRTPQTPPEGISGRLIYGRQGKLRSYNGKQVSDSVVMLDFNTGADWFNAPLLGAKAVLFIEPEETLRGEAEEKFMSMPIDLPRFWVPKEVADYLQAVLQAREQVRITVNCDMEWKEIAGKNIIGRIRGTHDRLSKQQVVIQAYYDSISLTPSKAPGAENACSLASLYELIKAIKDQEPKRTINFLATSGHFEGLAGTKSFIRERIRGGRGAPRVRQMFNLANSGRRKIEEAVMRVWEEDEETRIEKTEEEIVNERIRGLGRVRQALMTATAKRQELEEVVPAARREDPNAGKLQIRQLTEDELAERKRLIDKFDERLSKISSSTEEALQVVDEARKLGGAVSVFDYIFPWRGKKEQGSIQEKKQALARVRKAVLKVTDALDFSEEGISLWFSVDLSSHNEAFGVFYKGYFYNYRENIQWKFSDIGKKCREYGDLIGQALGVDPENRLADGINAIQGKNWQTYMAGQLALSNEVATLGGIPGVGFATIHDSRPWVDTPMDEPERVNLDNLTEQTRFLACLMCDLVNVEEPRDLYDLQLEDNFCDIKGRLVEFQPEVTTFPDEPIEKAVAVARTRKKTCMGVRGELFDLSNKLPPPKKLVKKLGEKEAGRQWEAKDGKEREKWLDENFGPKEREQWKDRGGLVHLRGLPNVRARGGKYRVEGYLLDDETGNVVMAPDLGINGAEKYEIELKMDQEIKPVTCVMFKCRAMALYDMIDQRFFELLREMYVFDASTNASPYEYGYCLPLPPQQFTSAYEPAAVVFAPSGTRVKVTMGASVLGLRFVLVNPTKNSPKGAGYLIDRYRSLYATPFRVAADMWELDDVRLEKLTSHGIRNDRVESSHKTARKHLGSAQDYLAQYRYDQFMTAVRSAWSYESRAYPDIKATSDDVIKGIIFYLVLLLPFSFFAERLLIASPDIRTQILGFFGIFLGVFILIGSVHPAFAITFTPVIILLAFIILALAVLVIGIVIQKFEEQMKEVRYEQTGLREADVGRLSASAAAFNLGIANMRRRKVRTLLTSLTLVLLTFTVLSCSSVVQGVRSNRIHLPKEASYNGIMIRDKTWEPIGEPTYRVMSNEFGDKYPVAPRAWYFSSRVGKQSFVTVARGLTEYSATAMVGLTPEEAKITNPDRYLKEGGRWFREGDNLVCIIPEGMADKLDIDPSQVGSATVSVFGTTLRVIGIVSSNRFKNHVEDLDGESITPVDYLLMQEQQAQQQQQGSGQEMSEDQLREYIHLAPDSVLFVPHEFVMNAGGTLRSVALGIPEAKNVRKHLNDLMKRVELNLYAGMDGETYLCSAVRATSFQGMSDLVIPILIAAAIVLNTMLGSVYERVQEIYIYSSLGLAPTHIAALFIAEASVYAVVGAIAGYLVGQMVAKVLFTFDLMTGLNLNYSSLAAVGATSIIMFTVLLSVIYPAKRASEIAMPGIERRWSLPEPEGDEMSMDLPFTVTGDQAAGVNGFLHEYLSAHADYSLGHFSTADIELEETQTEYGKGFSLKSMVWLAPYDLGVSEHLVLKTVPTEEEEVFQIKADIVRESGDESSWIRVTRNFVNMLRKQYLLWRTFPTGQKEEYGERGQKLLAGESLEETEE